MHLPDNLQLLENEPLAAYAHTQAGGPAEFLAQPRNVDELRVILQWATAQDLPVTIFGRLSNLVVRDGGLRGLVILLPQLDDIRVSGTEIVAQAGADLIQVAQIALENSLTGLEWSAGIPGSVGGAVYMNAGAYGGQSDLVVTHVTSMDFSGELHDYTADELAFGYRHSIFMERQEVILSATFSLAAGDKVAIREAMDDVNFKRANKQPLSWPSNGSVFKRPPGHFAGKLIMDAGLQGVRRGGVEVSTKHAGFMVNVANGTGNDYEDLIRHVQATIKTQFDVVLEPEVRILGER
ncbi:MAG TPA: UDP-N-acetylmuramate dehydrogenase [Lactobacillaceae bacterium]